jgi:hypothetical protein
MNPIVGVWVKDVARPQYNYLETRKAEDIDDPVLSHAIEDLRGRYKVSCSGLGVMLYPIVLGAKMVYVRSTSRLHFYLSRNGWAYARGAGKDELVGSNEVQQFVADLAKLGWARAPLKAWLPEEWQPHWTPEEWALRVKGKIAP